MWCVGLLVMWCQVAEPVPAQGATFCQVSRPIYWSAGDTRKTKEQVDRHNRVWKRLCTNAGAQK